MRHLSINVKLGRAFGHSSHASASHSEYRILSWSDLLFQTAYFCETLWHENGVRSWGNARDVCVVGPLVLSHGAENRVVATDGRTVLIVLRLCVAHLVKVGLKRKIADAFCELWLTIACWNITGTENCTGTPYRAISDIWQTNERSIKFVLKNAFGVDTILINYWNSVRVCIWSGRLTVEASMLPPNHTA